MKKLLIATDAYLPRWDGIARFLSEIIPHLHGYDVTVLAPKFPQFHGHVDPDTKVKVIRLESYRFRTGDYHPPKFHFKEIRQAVAEADIVWTHAIMPIGMLAIFYASRMGKPIIAHIHSIEWELALNCLSPWNIFRPLASYGTKLVARSLYNRCSLIITPSREAARKLSGIGVRVPKVVITMGVNTHRFRPPEDKEEAKKHIQISPEKKVIGYCGRLGREKDLMTLYKAFNRVRKETNSTLLIVGEGLKHLEDMFKKDINVKFIGATQNVIPYYQAMDVYVLPSLTETSSLSTMEAMSCGVAVLATKVGHLGDYITDKVNGCFFPTKNDLVLSLKLKWLFEKGSVRRVLGQNARETIINKYSWDVAAENIRGTLTQF
ncbi:MAG: glycosyltransferase [archaeon]